MKLKVLTLKGEVKGEVQLTRVGSEPVRKDLIIRAFLAERSKQRQAYGADPLAGQRSSAHYHGRRGIRNAMMNREMSRMKRIHGSGFLHFTARTIPGVVKGRKAHPPKAEKIWKIKINKKEREKAMLSAAAASFNKDLVVKRGHRVEEVKQFPLVVEDGLQGMKKAKNLRELMIAFGLKEEIERVKEKGIRGTKGKMRGRKYSKKKGPLVIVAKDEGIVEAGSNLQGFDIVDAKSLQVSDLSPGSNPGRLCIWTESALTAFDKGG